MSIGEKIEKLLNEQGLTQRDLATRVSVDETTISRIITGERKPKAEVVASIATALHTTSDYLLNIENDEFDINKITRIIARNSKNLSEEEKKEIISALF